MSAFVLHLPPLLVLSTYLNNYVDYYLLTWQHSFSSLLIFYKHFKFHLTILAYCFKLHLFLTVSTDTVLPSFIFISFAQSYFRSFTHLKARKKERG